MEWLKISTSVEMVRVATDEIVYVRADGNYSDFVLTNGKRRKMTFQLHFFEEAFRQLRSNPFVRVGRSLIVNKRYVHVINLTDQLLLFTGKGLSDGVKLQDDHGHPIHPSRESLKQLMDIMMEEKGDGNE